MKSISARGAKYGFGLMIDTARAEPVLIEKHGRVVVVVVPFEDYERPSVQSGHTYKRKTGPRGRRRVANEAFVRVKMDLVLKDADRSSMDGRSVRSECALDDDGSADSAPFNYQGRAQ